MANVGGDEDCEDSDIVNVEKKSKLWRSWEKNPSYVIISWHLKGLVCSQNSCQGYVDSEEKLNEFLEDFRIASGVSFITRNSLPSRYVFFFNFLFFFGFFHQPNFFSLNLKLKKAKYLWLDFPLCEKFNQPHPQGLFPLYRILSIYKQKVRY